MRRPASAALAALLLSLVCAGVGGAESDAAAAAAASGPEEVLRARDALEKPVPVRRARRAGRARPPGSGVARVLARGRGAGVERGAHVSRDVGPPPGEQAPDPSARGHDVLGVQLPRLRGAGGPSVRPPTPATPAAPAATGLPPLPPSPPSCLRSRRSRRRKIGRGRGVPREPNDGGGSLRGVPRRGTSVRLRRPRPLPRLRPRRAERHRLLRGRGPVPRTKRTRTRRSPTRAANATSVSRAAGSAPAAWLCRASPRCPSPPSRG